MAWLYRYKDSKKWWIGYRVNGKIMAQSTGTADEAEATLELKKVEMVHSEHKSKRPIDALYAALRADSGKPVATWPLRAELAEWVLETKKTASPATAERYEGIADNFADFVHATDTKPEITEVKTETVRAYLSDVLKRKSPATANQERKCLRVFFRREIVNGKITADPCAPIKTFRRTDDARRRPFTLEEAGRLLKVATPFWRYAILLGFTSGLRLGDIATLTVGQVDLDNATAKVATKKTGARITIYLTPQVVKEIRSRLKELKPAPKPGDFLWPDHAARRTGALSNEFHALLVQCGLAQARTHKSTGKGRGEGREVSAISFHSFRHGFVSNLKLSGAGQAIAKQLAGHSTDAISDHYTSLPADVLRDAINALPVIEC